ncbi:interferon-related developmental regulator 2 [Exaiptasia diaphana]|uniref:Interferon-related developmental regulator 1 n=1 Tax=Exaiptasia diaphana TaxID=2652724 RepID=A0A913XUL6_EXADI|nr:interferon-related developmental regulator 2 [Exaiptasia diaphana]KXJ24553.1 Interferon-related developmental regulator 1 [Exaiptasia diaphana]
MPKGNREGKGKRSDRQAKHGKRKASPKRMEDGLAVEDDEVMSTTSQTSVDTRSGDDFANEGADDSFEEIEVNSEQMLDDHLDGATQKSVRGRQSSLISLQKALKSKLLYEFVFNRKDTLRDCVERCLKRGQNEDKVLGSHLASLVCIQLGAGTDSENFFRALKPLFMSVIQDPTVHANARGSCCSALGLCCLIASENEDDLQDCARIYEGVFDNNKTITQALVPLYYNALLSWALLLTIIPNSYSRICKFLKRIIGILESSDITVRIAAGEVLAVMYEMARETNEDFQGDENGLCNLLKDLATDSDKHKAKKDLRQQRSSFRDVMRAIEDGSAPEEVIKFGSEYLEVYSWAKRRQYNAFKDCLGTGINIHLQGNDLLRDIFELGPPVNVEDVKMQKASKFERQMHNSAMSKARTLTRGKNRDKRNVSAY